MAGLALTVAQSNELRQHARIPLDLAGVIPSRGRFDRIVLRIGDLPSGAALSAGHNNGDRSWTLTPEELVGLYYLPAQAAFAVHCLDVQVIGLIDNDEGEILDRFELPVDAASDTPRATARSSEPLDYTRIKAHHDGALWAARTRREWASAARTEAMRDYLERLDQRLRETERQMDRLQHAVQEEALPVADLSESVRIDRPALTRLARAS